MYLMDHVVGIKTVNSKENQWCWQRANAIKSARESTFKLFMRINSLKLYAFYTLLTHTSHLIVIDHSHWTRTDICMKHFSKSLRSRTIFHRFQSNVKRFLVQYRTNGVERRMNVDIAKVSSSIVIFILTYWK